MHLCVIGKGTVKCWIETSLQKSHDLVLKNILHIDGIKKSFLSLGQLLMKGLDIQFE